MHIQGSFNTINSFAYQRSFTKNPGGIHQLETEVITD